MTDPMKSSSAENSSGTALPTHCVFRRGGLWLALPAGCVREVLPRPEMVPVPLTPPSFVGLCHVRSEFVPVLNLDCVAAREGVSQDEVMLILDGNDGTWSVLVDEVSALRTLEISDAPEEEQLNTVIGWATDADRVVHVLDPSAVRTWAERELARFWEDRLPLSDSVCETEVGLADLAVMN